MKSTFILIVTVLLVNVAMSQENLIGNNITSHPEYGHSLYVYDHRPETLSFMNESGLQGGGPTWMALIQAALELKSPSTLLSVEFDDEADGVMVRASSIKNLEVIQSLVSILMSDKEFLSQCIEKATNGGYIE